LFLSFFFFCLLIIGLPAFADSNTSIFIDPISDKHVGDRFTITALTTIPEENEIIVKISSPSTTVESATVSVIKSTSSINTITFDVDTSAYKPDEYTVFLYAKFSGINGTTRFTILDAIAPTQLPTNIPASAPDQQYSPTKSVNQLLEEQNTKIDEQNKLLDEQNQKLSEQTGILDQIIGSLKGLFGMKT
jgi:hypothetical protein